jgi:predicted transposase YbfD/YdcC
LSKKTCDLIIENGNDYVIAVKENQPKLYHHIQKTAANQKPISRHIETEKTRDRLTKRTVEVFDDLKGIDPKWTQIKSLIKVERVGTRRGKPYHDIAYYISSLIGTAQEFAHGIRGHWSIENRLHWVKDVVLNEDLSTIHTGDAPANISLVRAIVLNVLRRNGYTSITTAQRFISNDIDKLLILLE